MKKKNLVIKNYIQKSHLNSRMGKKLSSKYKKIFYQINNKLKIPNQFFYLFNKNHRLSAKISDLEKFKKFNSVVLIGMGGSILGSEAIYNFLNCSIKKKFYFLNDLDIAKINRLKKKVKIKNTLFIVISKSGNTIETLTTLFYLDILKHRSKNIIVITEKKNSILFNITKKLNLFFIEHKNYIGGRYSVLSEVGMLPAELLGLNERKFKRLNYLIKNKYFLNQLIYNVNFIFNCISKEKKNSVILNYDESSNNLFKWYQQLTAESLGKDNKGIFPIISSMPKDNHSLLQLYLDGPKNNFFTFFGILNEKTVRLSNKNLFDKFSILKNKNLNQIIKAQRQATQTVFKRKKIPFRSFEILSKNEETLGELFTFFVLETILLGRLMEVNPFDQPSVELIKTETSKLLI